MRSDNVLKFTRATSAVDQSPRFLTSPRLASPRLASRIGDREIPITLGNCVTLRRVSKTDRFEKLAEQIRGSQLTDSGHSLATFSRVPLVRFSSRSCPIVEPGQ